MTITDTTSSTAAADKCVPTTLTLAAVLKAKAVLDSTHASPEIRIIEDKLLPESMRGKVTRIPLTTTIRCTFKTSNLRAIDLVIISKSLLNGEEFFIAT